MCIFLGEFRCQNQSMLQRGHFDVAETHIEVHREPLHNVADRGAPNFGLYAEIRCAIENLVG